MKNKNILKFAFVTIMVVTFGVLAGVFRTVAFNGPSGNAGTGSGALGTDAAGNISIGTSTTQSNTKFLIVGSTTDSSAYSLQVWNSAKTPLFTVRNDGMVSTTQLCLGGTCNTIWPGGLAGGGTVNYVGKFTGTGTIGNSQIFDSGTNVGIGTASPGEKLVVKGGNTNDLMIDNDGSQYTELDFANGGTNKAPVYWDNANSDFDVDGMYIKAGNIGIGTSTPAYPIHIYGSAPRATIQGTTAGSNVGYRLQAVSGGGIARSAGYYLVPGDTNATTYLGLAADDASYQMVVTAGGNVGIGTASPGYTLDVVGKIHSSSGGYVFPDGTTQTTAATGGSSQWIASGTAIYYNGGNVGIGTAGPRQALEVNGRIINTAACNGNANLCSYDLGTGEIGALTVYGYNAICTGNAMGTCTGASGVVIGPSNTSAAVNITNSGQICFGSSCINSWPTGGGGMGGSGTANYVAKFTAGTTLGNSLIYDSGTNVGIGTVSPASKLSVGGGGVTGAGVYGSGGLYGVYGYGSTAGLYGDGTAGSYGVFGNGGTYGVLGQANGANVGVAGFGGSVGVYGSGTEDFQGAKGEYVNGSGVWTNSDERLKKDIIPISGSLAKIELLTPVTYEWKDINRGTGEQLGLIAQNVQMVFPQLVDADASGTLTLNYDRLTAPIIDAIKEQQQEINDLKAQNASLQKQITTLLDQK